MASQEAPQESAELGEGETLWLGEIYLGPASSLLSYLISRALFHLSGPQLLICKMNTEDWGGRPFAGRQGCCDQFWPMDHGEKQKGPEQNPPAVSVQAHGGLRLGEKWTFAYHIWILISTTAPSLGNCPLFQHHPVEPSMTMEMLYICSVQYGSHWAHGATEMWLGMTEQRNFQFYLIFINIDANRCKQPLWLLATPLGSSAELDFTLFLGKTRLFQVRMSLDSPWKTISGSLPTFEILTLKAFSLSVSSVTNTALATPCSFLGFKWAALQFTESAHKQKCMQLLRMLISRSKGNSKGLMQLNMCARYKNRTNRAFFELFQIQTTWKGKSTARKTERSGMRPSE